MSPPHRGGAPRSGPPVEIRPARIADLPALADLWRDVDELHARLWPTFFRAPGAGRPQEELEVALCSPDQAVLVAQGDGHLLGVIRAQIFDTPRAPLLVARRRLHVEELVVAHGARRRGIGRRLLVEAARWAQARGATEAVLVVWEGNAAADRFYRALGFRTVHRVLGMRLDATEAAARPRAARPPRRAGA